MDDILRLVWTVNLALTCKECLNPKNGSRERILSELLPMFPGKEDAIRKAINSACPSRYCSC